RLGRGLLAALARRPAVTVAAMLAPLPIPHATPLPVAKAETPLVALAVAVDLAHHRGGAILERVHANGQIAQDVLAEALLPLDLVEGGGRRVDVEHREMGLAVLAQAVGQRLDAPLLGLGDLAAHLLDDAFELRGQFLDLLRARVLARQETVFVARHADAFPFSAMLLPARSPSSLSGKARKLGRREHGTPGPSGPAVGSFDQAAVRSAPGRGSSGSARYRGFASKGK